MCFDYGGFIKIILGKLFMRLNTFVKMNLCYDYSFF